MRTLRTALLIAASAGVLAAASQAAAVPGVRLTPLASVRFPDRAFVITTAQPLALTSGQVQVRENGRNVSNLSVVPASKTTSRAFGVVLVLDASDSMRGKAITEAVAAARAFAAHRAAGEALGLITFNRSILVARPPTTDAKQISDSLASLPPLAEGTHLWDAASRAIDELRNAKITAGSIVLLTDGTDTGSSISADKLASKALAAGMRIFSVGLRSAQFSPGALEQLARRTGAFFSEVRSAASLAAIYGSLSENLAREYLFRYRSNAAPGQAVRVAVTIAGASGVAAWSYRTPALPSTPAAPFHRSLIDRIVSSPASVALIALLAAVLAAFGVSSILKPNRSTIRHRVGEFVSVAGPDSGTGRASLSGRLVSRGFTAAEGTFQRSASWARFKEELEMAGLTVRPVPLAAGTVAASIMLALLGLLSPVLALLTLAPPLLVRAWYKEKLRKRRLAFEEQLPDNLTVLAASLRAGHGFVGGLSSVLDEAEEPTKSELRRALADEQLGVPIEDALLHVAARMASGDLEQVALVASLQRQTGGNTAEVLDAVVNSIRERFQLRRLVRALTAQGRLARWVLTALPVVAAAWITLVNPHYMSPLLHTTVGQVLLTVAVVMVIAGSLVVKRITDIEI